jgi:hypothetical protein
VSGTFFVIGKLAGIAKISQITHASPIAQNTFASKLLELTETRCTREIHTTPSIAAL